VGATPAPPLSSLQNKQTNTQSNNNFEHLLLLWMGVMERATTLMRAVGGAAVTAAQVTPLGGAAAAADGNGYICALLHVKEVIS
jgi:hypothetical protein